MGTLRCAASPRPLGCEAGEGCPNLGEVRRASRRQGRVRFSVPIWWLSGRASGSPLLGDGMPPEQGRGAATPERDEGDLSAGLYSGRQWLRC